MKRVNATSSPVRVNRCAGIWYFEVAAYEVNGKHYCGMRGMGNTYQAAKANFWENWKEAWPNVYLDSRLSK